MKLLKLFGFQKLISACPQNDWIVLNNTCYKFQNKTSNFKSANDICNNLGGKNFEPKNINTYDTVHKIANKNMKLNYGAWIGISTNKTDDWTLNRKAGILRTN